MTDTICPHCGAKNDGATDIEDGEIGDPEPGDLALCWSCGGATYFDDDGSLRLPTAEEQIAIDNDPIVQDALIAWRKTNGKDTTI